MEGLFGDGRGEGLVAVVLSRSDDIFKEDLRREPRLEVSVDLVEMDDKANCVALLRPQKL